MKRDICDLTLEELEKEMTDMGEPRHRAKQVFRWVNGKYADSFEKMTNLPKGLIFELDSRFEIGRLVCAEHLSSKDGTEKFLWVLRDKEHIETVLIRERSRVTLCLSTQVGCRFRCPFCASGSKGFIRDLSVSEIVGQVAAAQKSFSGRVTNIVFMGMGEPLDNYDNLIKVIRILNHPDGGGIGARKMTVSTCGIVPEILKLKDLGVQVELSVSLHAANDSLRDELVPSNRKYPLNMLVEACVRYFKDTGRIITLEYTLIKNVNDREKDAAGLAGIAKRINAKVNLIACSSFPGSHSEGPERAAVEDFKQKLIKLGAKVTVRRSKGADIMAACGQLAAGGKRSS
ncbi:MAG: 23S rRNA (adenine(2503)-C(2))-methyltransferase RlmN [Candidatus Tantalella remota]|nr:23S rRNA (adenine(2503)-C(2))-methyltransferase RlmN [Candidatus Tantalella remota]